MTLVAGTVASLDPNARCADNTCAQFGELLRDHRVTHRAKAGPKNQKGTCPFCGGQVHNLHDKATTIQFDCQLRQAVGVEVAKKTEDLTADVYRALIAGITSGRIKEWATRDKLDAILKAGAPSGVTAPTTTTPAPGPTAKPASTSQASAPTPATPPPAVPVSAPAAPAPSAPVPVAPVVPIRPKPAVDPSKLAAILRGARMTP